MNRILANLTSEIDRLRTCPDTLDVTHVIDVLSQAYEAASLGLSRSLNADLLSTAQKEIEGLSLKLTSLSENASAMSAENQSLKNQIKSFLPLVESIKMKLAGKVALLKDYSSDLKKTTSEKILSTSDLDELVKIQTRIESDFSKTWSSQNMQAPLSDKPIFIENPKHYQSGV